MLKLLQSLFKSNASAFDPEAVCPECGSPLYRESVQPQSQTRCPNLDCPAQIRMRIQHWGSNEAMNIPELTSAMVEKLVGNGLVRDVAELYRLKLAEIAAMDGVDPSAAQQLFDSITASRTRDAWRLLHGLAIPSVTPADAQTLCKAFGSVDNVFAASTERLMAAGATEVCARNIVQWHGDGVNRRLVKRLFKAGLNFRA
mgnify:CR=1 FL=1